MDNKQIAVKLILDNLDLKFSMDTFQDRLILQKAIYLVQSVGINLGYHYSWYLKGPYSTSLAADGFSIRDELITNSDESEKWQLDALITDKLELIQNWFSQTNKAELAKQLELYASVHFLIEKKQMSREIKGIVAALHQYGKQFSEFEVEEAVKGLLQHGALN